MGELTSEQFYIPSLRRSMIDFEIGIEQCPLLVIWNNRFLIWMSTKMFSECIFIESKKQLGLGLKLTYPLTVWSKPFKPLLYWNIACCWVDSQCLSFRLQWYSLPQEYLHSHLVCSKKLNLLNFLNQQHAKFLFVFPNFFLHHLFASALFATKLLR